METLLKTKEENNLPFNSGVTNLIFILIKYVIKATRFNYAVKDEYPGPGTYEDTLKVDWSKRSYNVAFAEI